MTAILLSPIVLIFSVIVAVGSGFDIFALAGEAPVVVALCIPALFLLIRHVRAHAAAGPRPQPGSAAALARNYTPKSIN